jgi:hypothetical protein
MKSLIIAVLLTTVLAAPALACREEVRDPHASITLCGDPRAHITLDNSDSTMAVPFRVVFWNAKTDIRQKIVRQVGPGDTLRLVRWVHGDGRKVSIYDAVTNDVLARVTVDAANHTGPCPA